MTKIKLSYNPYRVKSHITIDGKLPNSSSQFIDYLDEHFQLWVHKIPLILFKECTTKEFDLVFTGTDLDYNDLVECTTEFTDLIFNLTHIKAKDFGEKETELKCLFEEIKLLPFKSLRSSEFENFFNNAFNKKLEINVVATMSAGKSTLINALLCNDLMPSENSACTALITRITNDDSDSFKATAYHKDTGEIICNYDELTYDIMCELNANQNIGEIHVTGNIPFVNSNEISLVLIDTPGVDNGRDANHRIITQNLLKASSKDLVLFVMDGTHLQVEGESHFLDTIAESIDVKRFLFVVSKLDTYDDDEDIAGKTLPNILEYLKEKNIKNPYIFLTGAKPALKARQIQKGVEFKPNSLNKINNSFKNLIEDEQLHLEQYLCSNPALEKHNYKRLSRTAEKAILAELEEAIYLNDIAKQAVVHSGIRGLEETIKNYVYKYERPSKINNIVTTLQKELETILKDAKEKQNLITEIIEKLSAILDI